MFGAVAISIVCVLSAATLWHMAEKRGANTLFWAIMGAVFGPLAIPFVFLTKKIPEKSTASTQKKNRVCPVENAGSLDNKLRRWVQNPRKIVKPYVQEGMTVLDVGCGPGFFSIDMAELVGESGRVIAADLQDGMLRKLRNKIRGTELETRITLHLCEKDRIGVSAAVDFVLVFYVFHEVPDQKAFLDEIGSLLKPDGRVFIVEPPFHVSKSSFERMIAQAGVASFELVERPKVFFGKTAVLKKSESEANSQSR
jgi:2-polyprenyl-3-methyl-5-hydroxy-6-metoxy-1,4-benzoquinol methylase